MTSGSGSDAERGVTFGWKVHNAQEAWTARLDSKAALFLATQLAVLGGIVSQLGATAPLGSLQGRPRTGMLIGVLLSAIAVLAAGGAVAPQLGRSKTLKAESADRLIYFGHLRHWAGREQQLATAMKNLSPDAEVVMVAAQNVAQAQRNWLKHLLLQLAMLLGAAGAIFVVVSYLVERGIS